MTNHIIDLIGTEELYLEPEETIKNVERIADLSLSEEKYPFIIRYSAAEKDVLISGLEKVGCTVLKQLDFANCVAVSMSTSQLKAIKTLKCVELVEKDYDYRILSDNTQDMHTPDLDEINIIAETNSKIKLAIFDSGISNTVNIAIEDIVSFIDDDSTNDLNGHGTQMAGIICSVIANTENRKANPIICSAVVADFKGVAKTSTIMEALDWAIHNDIKIINMSLGDYHHSHLLEEMINRVSKYGIVMIAAAGNDGGFKDETRIMYPAAFDQVLCVGAKNGETVANYSSGGTNADCFASGTQNTIDINGNAVYVTGTSAATAFIAGTVLKNWCVNPNNTAENIVSDIKSTMRLNLPGDENIQILTIPKQSDNISNVKSDQISNLNVVVPDPTNGVSDHSETALLSAENNSDLFNRMATASMIPFFYWQSGNIRCPCGEQWYKFVANIDDAHPNRSPGWYTVHTKGSLDTIGYLYDSNGNQVAYDDDDNNGLNFNLWAKLDYGKTYYIRVKAYGNNTGEFDIRVSYMNDDHGNTFKTATQVIGVYYEDKSISGHLHGQDDVDYYVFTPARSCVMEIYTEGDTNTYGRLYCESGSLIDSDNNSNGNDNFKITAHLEGMKIYYIAVSHTSSAGYGDYTLRFKFIKDYYRISSDYYYNNKKSLIAWYNPSYTAYPDKPSYTSTRYYMYMNQVSVEWWRDNFLTNKTFAEQLKQAITDNLPSAPEIILDAAGIEHISWSDVAVDIIADILISLIAPYIDELYFQFTYKKMTASNLMCVEYSTVQYLEPSGNIDSPMISTYDNVYNYTLLDGNYIYGKPYFRGTWELIESNDAN